MKKDLRSMLNQAGSQRSGGQGQTMGGAKQPTQSELDALGRMAAQYEGKSEGELMNELMAQVARQKAEGNFSPESLQRFMTMAAPMLDEEKQKKLRDIVSRIQ